MEKQSNTQKTSWTKGKFIGRGSFGTVSLAINETNGDVFAVKSVDLATSLPNQLECLENEIRTLHSLSSPYVVKYLGDDVTPADSSRNLHLEYMSGGTVSDEANVKRRLADVDERVLRWHTRCLVSALKYLHGEGIVHCDVKGINVLLDSDSTSVKLADFGSAIAIKKESAGDIPIHPIKPRGSPLWMAPEVIRGEYQGPESDVWSLGCTVVEMITGKPAWGDQGFDSLCRIANSDELPELPTQLSDLGKDFVERCLRRDPNRRWNCDQLLQHPFVASASPPKTIGESSPRCVIDFPSSDFDEKPASLEWSARERIGKLAGEGGVIWESDGWATVRSYSIESRVNCEEGTSEEYPEWMRTSLEMSNCFETGISNSGNSVDRQCGDIECVEGVKSSFEDLRCRWLAESSCRYGFAVKGRLRFNRFCNLLHLILLDLFYYLLKVLKAKSTILFETEKGKFMI
ncbi:Clathrin, heavy chain isoform 1 [Hibiscus syriacus]|uniref:Clathrin, heavy chain isoform 1 n=1 Tax=Hibiscus syriacus TaxID=106335 RepID=A0A6A3B9T3_HIBSY|nr:mitogen-activated protein kinase kinase kinase 18-like [Hibiscus syriacus]KAE8712737.1 Clathrin, heavy chain isoform 1 [Hibiscus syriacus]